MNFKRLIRQSISALKTKNTVPVYSTIESEKEFQNHTALVVGGSGGIGKEIAKELLGAGCNVIITGSHEGSLKRAEDELGCNENLSGVVLDLQKTETYNSKIEEAAKLYNGIDIFIDCAGVHTECADFWTISQAEYERVMNINLRSTYFLCQAIASYMKSNSKRGHILLISSSRGEEPAWSPYGISKWGLNGFIKGLAKILIPYGIVVNGIAPGSTATPLLDYQEGDTIYTEENNVGRYVLPKEVALYARMLVSNAGNMVVGEVVTISGGRGSFDIR